jgi:hypothetical protein
MTDNIDWKKVLTETLKKLNLLNNNTEKIEINCNSLSVSDVKVTTRVK